VIVTSNDNERTYEYDLFISYSTVDKGWVRGELLARLQNAGLKVWIDVNDVELGKPAIQDLEDALVKSQKTLLVLTPDYLNSKWTTYERYILQSVDPVNNRGRLIPILKEPCTLPTSIGFLNYANFTDPEEMDIAWRQLFRAFGIAEVTGEPQHSTHGQLRDYVAAVPVVEQVTTKVFISYSRDSEDHQKKVLSLTQALRDDGIHCMIDQFVMSPDNWDRWMLDQIEESDFVLIICSERYYQRYRGKEEIGKGLGVTWESTLIMESVYKMQGKNDKFYPVFFSPPDREIIPNGIRTSFYDLSGYNLSNLETDPNRWISNGDYEKLYRLLTGQPSVVPGEIGSLRKLEPIARKSVLPPAPLPQDARSLAPSMLETDSKIVIAQPRANRLCSGFKAT
jgi:TIR domain/SEFIR domain